MNLPVHLPAFVAPGEEVTLHFARGSGFQSPRSAGKILLWLPVLSRPTREIEMQHALIERALSVPPSPSPGPRPPTALFDAQGTATRFWLRGFTYHAESYDDDDRTTDLFLGIDAIARDLQQRLAAATLRRLGNTEVIVEKDLSNLDPTRLHVYIEGLLNRPVL